MPRGPHASPQQVADVQHWWSREIEPYKALILGPHEARLVAAMSPVDQWSYQKYRYDVHFYYKNVPPPPPGKCGKMAYSTCIRQSHSNGFSEEN